VDWGRYPATLVNCGYDGQARFTNAAIHISLMARKAFKLPLRLTEGLIISVLKLMELRISAPDHNHTTVRCTH
jgi:hypothetical protein